MRIALMFQQWDVDAFKAAVDADQWAKWQQFEATEPSGWRGVQVATGHLAYHIRQAAAPRAKLDYTKFAPRLVTTAQHQQTERARWEAFASSTQHAKRK